jgi:lipopolysaccharide biosynthesis regulator YciM
MAAQFSILIFLLLAIFVAGYFFRRSGCQKNKTFERLHQGYLRGLTLLLNEESDKAVDVFIQLLEVDSDTVETHLALGKLFRKRGEVDRAIRIHQNLIARPNLDVSYRIQALIALGHDYLAAGVLDRAERVFNEVRVFEPEQCDALSALLDIYQREHHWVQAKPVIAHHYCELAQEAITQQQVTEAQLFLRQALAYDVSCVRAHLLRAEIYIQQHNYHLAIKNLKKIKDTSPHYLSEIITPLTRCYEQLGDQQTLLDYLSECLQKHPQTPLYLLVFEHLKKLQKPPYSEVLVRQHIEKHPSINGLSLYLDILLDRCQGSQSQQEIAWLHAMTKTLSDPLPRYRCQQCGFSSMHLHWHCPSCKTWGNVRPIHSYDELSDVCQRTENEAMLPLL